MGEYMDVEVKVRRVTFVKKNMRFDLPTCESSTFVKYTYWPTEESLDKIQQIFGDRWDATYPEVGSGGDQQYWSRYYTLEPAEALYLSSNEYEDFTVEARIFVFDPNEEDDCDW